EKLNNAQVLIYGATGSVGAAAIQVAKYYNADVTAVCSNKGKELTRKMKADEIICYVEQDFTQTTKRFDIIFDAVGKTNKKACAHLLKPKGSYVTVGGLSVSAEKKEQLELLKKLFEA